MDKVAVALVAGIGMAEDMIVELKKIIEGEV